MDICFRYIKMSSPNMNNIILSGAMLAYFSIIVCGLSSYVSNFTALIWSCRVTLYKATESLNLCVFYPLYCCFFQIFNWSLALSFSLAFGAMFSKTWRVHKVFTNKRFRRVVSQVLGTKMPTVVIN